MSKPFKIKSEGWYVQTPDGLSGPWKSEKAAEYAAEGDWKKAQRIENYWRLIK